MFASAAALLLAALSTPPIDISTLPWPDPAVETVPAEAPVIVPAVPEAEAQYRPEAGTVSIRCPMTQCDLIVEVTRTTGAWRTAEIDGRMFTLRADVRNAIELPIGFPDGEHRFAVQDATVTVTLVPHMSDPGAQLASAFP